MYVLLQIRDISHVHLIIGSAPAGNIEGSFYTSQTQIRHTNEHVDLNATSLFILKIPHADKI